MEEGVAFDYWPEALALKSTANEELRGIQSVKDKEVALPLLFCGWANADIVV